MGLSWVAYRESSQEICIMRSCGRKILSKLQILYIVSLSIKHLPGDSAMEMLWLDVRDKLFDFGIILWGWGVVNNCFGVCPNSRICVSRATFSLGSIILYKTRYIIKPKRQVLFFPPLPWRHVQLLQHYRPSHILKELIYCRFTILTAL